MCGLRKLSKDRWGETSESVRKRIQAARDIQNKRFVNGEATDNVCRAKVRVGEMRLFCKMRAVFDARVDESDEFVSRNLS